MILKNFVIYKVCVVCVNVYFGFVTCQDDGIQPPSDPTTTSEAPEAASELICQTCNCTSPGVVDCSSRDIVDFFEIQDWDALKPLSPISVDLSQNHLTTVSRISQLPIQHLNLSHCDIITIEDGSFVYLADLVTVDLSYNKITTTALSRRVFGGVLTQGGLKPYSKARRLSLTHNDIHSLPADVFAWMPGVTRLDLSGNPLAYIDQVTMAAITDLVSLRELYMDGCELESLPDGIFRRQRRLQRLDLSDNRFTTVPGVLNEAVNLLYLNFGKNPIQVLATENSIKNLTKLQELRLSRNSKLQSIESGALGGLANLLILHISYNPRLTTISADFLQYTDEHAAECWPLLTEFHLNNNNLSTLDSGYVHRWDQLSSVDFSNNPYVCDCRNQWAVDVLTPLLLKMDDNATDNMVCLKPPEYRGVAFARLHADNKTLSCPENRSYLELPVPNMAILLGVMIGIFVTFPIVLILVLLWRRGYFARCRPRKEGENDEETDAF